jgi:TRAP-type mannitol/chloroaromatic compound transport system permease large subunit
MIEFLPVLVLVLTFVVLLIIGVPVAWCIAISSMFTLMLAMPVSAATTTVSQRIATGLDSFALLAIPFLSYLGKL